MTRRRNIFLVCYNSFRCVPIEINTDPSTREVPCLGSVCCIMYVLYLAQYVGYSITDQAKVLLYPVLSD